jgi:23S rRNA (cytosine1962-C5)-methyltransferase
LSRQAKTRQFSNAKTPYVVVSAKLKTQLGQGHPWVYRDALERVPVDLASGTWVRVKCANLQFFGLWEADSPIAIRIFSSRQRPNKKWVANRLQQAWNLRSPLRNAGRQTSAYRWLYGESDGLPGIVVDLYGDVESGALWAVLKTYAISVEQRIMPWVVDALQAIVPLTGVIQRGSDEKRGANLLAGRMPSGPITIEEYGLRFEVDVLRGQKTGFFLDQRENRHTVAQWSQGRRVLNLFSYTGGFSIYAARGGATQVTSVDSASAAMAVAERNFALNGFDAARHDSIVVDCFELLERYHGEGRRFDLIVVDPPSFAHAKEQVTTALGAYQRLNALALKCLAPTGILASSSCSSQVSPAVFRQMLARAATAAKRHLLIFHDTGQALDHPVPAHFPEGRYLKFVMGQSGVIV